MLCLVIPPGINNADVRKVEKNFIRVGRAGNKLKSAKHYIYIVFLGNMFASQAAQYFNGEA